VAFVIPLAIAAADAVGSAAAGAGVSAGLGATAAGATDVGLSAGALAGTTAAAAGTGVATAGISGTTLAALGTTVASGAVGAYGAIQQGNAAAAAAKYNASVAGQNAAIERVNAQIAGQSGEAQAGIQGQKTKMAIGQAFANEGASGIDIGSGSSADTRSSMRELGEIDTKTTLTNAARQAYGYQVKATSDQSQSALDTFQAQNDTTAGSINAATTFLGSVGSAGSEFQKYQMASGLGI
jgi:hypothetical protein